MFVPMRNVEAAIAFDDATGASFNGALTLTFSHTVTSSGSDRVLIVGAASRDDGNNDTITGVTYDGAGMTKITDRAGDANGYISLWFLANPSTGANNVVITGSGTAGGKFLVGGAVSFTGVDQSTPTGSATATAASGHPTVNVSSATGEVVIDAAMIVIGPSDTLSVGVDQTERVNDFATNDGSSNPANSRATMGMSTEPGDTTVTMSWTASDPTSNRYNTAAVPLQGTAAPVTAPVKKQSEVFFKP